MKKHLALPALVTAIGSFAIMAGSPLSARAEDPAKSDSMLNESGRKLFETHCVACHGFNGTGNGPVASALTPKPADLTSLMKRHGSSFSWGDIAKYIDGRTEVPAHGKREMPVWGKVLHAASTNEMLREEEIHGDLAALIQYLKSIQVK